MREGLDWRNTIQPCMEGPMGPYMLLENNRRISTSAVKSDPEEPIDILINGVLKYTVCSFLCII